MYYCLNSKNIKFVVNFSNFYYNSNINTGYIVRSLILNLTLLKFKYTVTILDL